MCTCLFLRGYADDPFKKEQVQCEQDQEGDGYRLLLIHQGGSFVSFSTPYSHLSYQLLTMVVPEIPYRKS